jgi:hypothetical protein
VALHQALRDRSGSYASLEKSATSLATRTSSTAITNITSSETALLEYRPTEDMVTDGLTEGSGTGQAQEIGKDDGHGHVIKVGLLRHER